FARMLFPLGRSVASKSLSTLLRHFSPCGRKVIPWPHPVGSEHPEHCPGCRGPDELTAACPLATCIFFRAFARMRSYRPSFFAGRICLSSSATSTPSQFHGCIGPFHCRVFFGKMSDISNNETSQVMWLQLLE